MFQANSTEEVRATGKIVTDGLCSYCAATKEIGNADRHMSVAASTTGGEFSSAVSTTRARYAACFEARRRCKNSSSVHAEVHVPFQSGGAARPDPRQSLSRESAPIGQRAGSPLFVDSGD